MYPIPDFKERDPQVVIEFMRTHEFATLIGTANDAAVATHVPMLVKETDGQIFLEGHIMRNTDHHRAFMQNSNVLVIFNGPNCYVSSSWYTVMSASTWNYMTVHARGKMTFLDEHALRRMLQETTDKYERGSASPRTFDKLPDDYINGLIKAIVGFRIAVTSLEHIFKLSQNHDELNRRIIIEHLRERGGGAALIAGEMEKRLSS